MISDRRSLQSRLDSLRRLADDKGHEAIAARIEQLAADIEASAIRVIRRRESAPRPAVNPFDMPPPEVRSRLLPISQRADEIAKVIDKHQVCVICGETGSGKTTQLPQICLALGRGDRGMIGHTQPRRIAARAVAQRIAEELSVPISSTSPVGYKVRFGDQTGERTLVKLMTDGILLAETASDRDLLAYDTIIIDEAHERSLNIDFLLGYLRQLMPRRPDLKIIITSATIDPQRLSQHFGGPEKCPVVEVSGRTYPVEVRYRPPINPDEDDFELTEEEALLAAVDELLGSGLPSGDILVFFPGEREIRLAAEFLRKKINPSIELLPLYARLSPTEQQRVFAAHRGTRIVLSTNVAETSLTVPGIRYVIDTGLARISRYSHRTKIQRLPIESISQASANQRSGRCGRVAEGVAIRLYSEEEFRQRPTFTDPEILRTNLASVILQMKSLRLGPVEEFPFVEPPDARMIRDGYDTLTELGALDEAGNLTEVGRKLARLPVDPKVGRMLLAAEDEQCLAEVLPLAAVLSAQDPRDRPMEKAQAADQAQSIFKNETSDFLTLLNIWTWWRKGRKDLSWNQLKKGCHDKFLSFNRMREWEETTSQLRSLCEELDLAINDENKQPAGDDAIHRALLTGLLDNILMKNEAAGANSGEYRGPRGITAMVFPGSVLHKKGGRWLVAAELVQTTKLYARTCCRIQPEWIEKVGSHLLKRSHADVHYHAETGRVCAWERIMIHGLPLVTRRRVDYGPVNPVEARDVFIYDALVNGAYEPATNVRSDWFAHNKAVMDDAQRACAKLRRHDLIEEKTKLHNFFDARLAAGISTTHQFEAWRRKAEHENPKVLFMQLADILPTDLAEQVDEVSFPDYVPLGSSLGLIEYNLEPGKPIDGLTLVVPLETLSALDTDHSEWLVPGMLPDKIAALLKGLPKNYRTQLVGTKTDGQGDSSAGLAPLAKELASLLAFGKGRLPEELSKAVDALRGIDIPPDAWPLRGIPDHLRLAIRVVTEEEHPSPKGPVRKEIVLAEGRDLEQIKKNLAGRAKRALSALAKQEFGREGLTKWDFEEDGLPETIEVDRAGAKVIGYPCLVDAGETVSISLADTAETAKRLTRRGLIRLFAIACKDEITARLRALPDADAMYKLYGTIGETAELKRDLASLICEKTFLDPRLGDEPRTKQEFEDRQAAQWGRLGGNTIEMGRLVHSVLSGRQKVAHRLSAGTPKQWESSIADLREHMAWLIPPGAFALVPLARLIHYPRYVDGMQKRLEKLREGGTAKEATTLPQVLSAWKRMTGSIAQQHAEQRKHDAQLPPEPGTALLKTGPAGNPRSGLNTSLGKRTKVVIASDDAAWCMHMLGEGLMDVNFENYRWMTEEFRIASFAQELGTAQPASPKRLDELWAKVRN